MGSAPETRMVDSTASTSSFRAVILCFFLSGLAALLYQTAWMRQFAVVFGTSELAIATVLSAYMAGLALGAAVAGRWIERVRKPIVVYGLLELGVAAGALLVPVELMAVRWLQRSVLGGLPELPDSGGLAQPLFYVLTAFAVILLPTACMGATLPLLTRFAVHSEEQIGRRVGTLYAMNTCGAVVGTLLAAFFLLPNFGLFRTTLFGVAANIAVLVIAVRLARQTTNDSEASTVSREKQTWEIQTWVLPIMFVSGAVSFLYEVLWSRLLGQIVGGSVYAFATMLATFLIGITIGSAIAARLATTRRQALVGLTLSQIGIGLLSMLAYGSLDDLPAMAAAWNAGAGAGLLSNVALCGSIMLPAALCIGATFPFAVRILANDETDAAPASARVYAWNTIGGVLGAIAAGFVVIPEFGFAGTIRIAVVCNLLLAVGTLSLHSWPRFGSVARRRG